MTDLTAANVPPAAMRGHAESAAAEVEHTIAATRARVADARASGRRVALVPTMGALHAGHVALVRRARELVDGGATAGGAVGRATEDEGEAGAADDIAPRRRGLVVVSVFVNPLQFGPSEDFERYPRTLDTDVAALAGLADVVFAPAVTEMYPDGPTRTRITGGAASTLFEGASRPGHFDGMLTVVAKLLNIVQPDAALFGRKDAQQVFLVRQMVADLDLPVHIEAVPTVRESDGLALSSRNRFLDDDGRAAAVQLSRALSAAADAASRGVVGTLAAARAGLAAPVKLDYLAIVDPRTFHPVDDAYRGPATVLIAARVGDTRLIDNATVTIG